MTATPTSKKNTSAERTPPISGKLAVSKVKYIKTDVSVIKGMFFVKEHKEREIDISGSS